MLENTRTDKATRIASVIFDENTQLESNSNWHSSIGFETKNGKMSLSKKRVASLPSMHEYTKMMFINAGCDNNGSNLLIHKTRNCLWKFDESGKKIIPVFQSDVLTASDLEEDISLLTQEL